MHACTSSTAASSKADGRTGSAALDPQSWAYLTTSGLEPSRVTPRQVSLWPRSRTQRRTHHAAHQQADGEVSPPAGDRRRFQRPRPRMVGFYRRAPCPQGRLEAALARYVRGPTERLRTRAFNDSAQVAVSAGLLQSMKRDEVKALLGHEVAHVAIGDIAATRLIWIRTALGGLAARRRRAAQSTGAPIFTSSFEPQQEDHHPRDHHVVLDHLRKVRPGDQRAFELVLLDRRSPGRMRGRGFHRALEFGMARSGQS